MLSHAGTARDRRFVLRSFVVDAQSPVRLPSCGGPDGPGRKEAPAQVADGVAVVLVEHRRAPRRCCRTTCVRRVAAVSGAAIARADVVAQVVAAGIVTFGVTPADDAVKNAVGN